MRDELKKALDIALEQEARGEVTHYDSVEDLIKALDIQ